MHLFRSRFQHHDPHPHGRFGGFWHAAFHRRHGFDHHHVGGPRVHGPFTERLQSRAAAFLDLNDTQAELMARLFEQLRTARRAAKAVAGGADVAALFATENFRREEAQALFDQQVDKLKAAGPAAITAFADFFDALDFEQQQMLRFVLRRRARRAPADDAEWTS